MRSTSAPRRDSSRPRFATPFLVLSMLLLRPAAADENFVRGEVNGTGRIDISDPIAILGCLFSGEVCPPCRDALDADDSGRVDISDPLRLLAFLYRGAPPPPPPNTCGPDPTADGLSCEAYPPCETVDPVKLLWPLPGTEGRDWVITRYVDLDHGPGLQDYSGATGASARTAAQYTGTNIDVPSFRAMDAGFPVLAAADGEVIETHDGEPDRNLANLDPCNTPANYIILLHADGTWTRYGKLKKDSIAVEVGDEVEAGDQLAVVGGSGCSDQANLYFGVGRGSHVIDPFQEQRWIQPPAYESPLKIMDVSLKAGGFQDLDEVKDPPASNIAEVTPESTLGIGLSLANGSPADLVQVQLRSPRGFPVPVGVISPDPVERHSFHRFNVELRDIGEWTLFVFVKGVVRHQSRFGVHHPTGYQAFGFEMTESRLKESLEDEELRPVAADGFSFGSGALFNVVWERSPGVRSILMYNIPGTLIRTLIDTNSQMGYRVVDLDSYRVGNQVLFLALMTDEPGPEQELFLGLPEPALLSMLQNFKGLGFFPVDMSIVDLGDGIKIGTALCVKRAANDLIHMHGLTSSQFQSIFDQQAAQGLRLLNLDGYNDDSGAVRFTAIWDSRDTGGWAARHDMDGAQLSVNLVEFGLRQRLKTRFITGYYQRHNIFSTTTAFGAFWSKR